MIPFEFFSEEQVTRLLHLPDVIQQVEASFGMALEDVAVAHALWFRRDER